MSTLPPLPHQPVPAPHDGNGHFHIPKWLVPILLTYVVTQGGASIFGTIKQSSAADAANKSVETQTQTATALESLAKEAKEGKDFNKVTAAQIAFLHQQLIALNTRVSTLEAKDKKP
jgi:hypothetical protein